VSPVVFRYRGYKFHFFANEGTPREPVHVHVTKDGVDAKFWLWPEVHVAYNDGFDQRTMRLLTQLVTDRRAAIDEAWNDFFRNAD
jgi:hypothetical protein